MTINNSTKQNLMMLCMALCLQLLLLTPVPHNAEPSSSLANNNNNNNESLLSNSNQNHHHSNKHQMSRSDPISPSSSSSSSSNSGTSYYTNDISSFLNAVKLPSSTVAANNIPYQALLQALSSSSSSSSPSQASSSVQIPQPSSQSSSSWMTLPSMMMSAPSSLMSTILRPMTSQTPIGGRRSSLTSRLRNIMNSLFYRDSSTPMMTSSSSNSYSYRPAPYGFAAVNPYGGGNDFSEYTSSLYGSNYLYGGERNKPSMYGAASNYRPSYVAMPSVSAPFMAGAWPQSPSSSSSPMKNGMYGRNYGMMSSFHSQQQQQPYINHHQQFSQQQQQQQYHHPHNQISQQYPMSQQPSSKYYPPQQQSYSMSESVPSITNAYNGPNGPYNNQNQWSSNGERGVNNMQHAGQQQSINNLDRPFIGPNNAVWSQSQNNNNSNQWSSSIPDDSGYGSSDGSRDEGASYYASNVFQSRISSPSSQKAVSSSSSSSSSSSMMPSPTYVASKFS